MPLHAEASMEEPFELMRTLRVLQDKVAKGDTGAHNAQQQVMSELSRQLTAIAPEFWKEPRNLRAAALYVFGGGDPGVLRTILGFGGLPQPEAELARGALAYAEGRDEEARTLLLPIDARELDPGIAGTVALVQSTLIAKVDPEKAMSLLEQSRLLSP